jgi:hypothetical protein
MKYPLTAIAALLLGTALAASAQAQTTSSQSMMPNNQMPSAQTSTMTEPQATMPRKQRAHRHVVKAHKQTRLHRTAMLHKRTGKMIARHQGISGSSTKMARLHQPKRTVLAQRHHISGNRVAHRQQSQEIGAGSSMPNMNTNPTIPSTNPAPNAAGNPNTNLNR